MHAPVTVTYKHNIYQEQYHCLAVYHCMSSACKQAQLECSPKDPEPWSITYGHALVRIHESLASLPIIARHCLALAEPHTDWRD